MIGIGTKVLVFTSTRGFDVGVVTRISHTESVDGKSTEYSVDCWNGHSDPARLSTLTFDDIVEATYGHDVHQFMTKKAPFKWATDYADSLFPKAAPSEKVEVAS